MQRTVTDNETASAFAESWNSLPIGSIYTSTQVEDWLDPLTEGDISGKEILELGCGNASLILHVLNWNPKLVYGIDLGDSVLAARTNLSTSKFKNWSIEQADLVKFRSKGFDIVYAIGVLHHLQNPRQGFDSVVSNVKSGGKFHCWVYAKEGNALIIHLVEPLRRFANKLNWKVIKYLFALPLATIFFIYTKLLLKFIPLTIGRLLPLYQYCARIGSREFKFFRHVVFDQLVSPQTVYIDRKTITGWLVGDTRINKQSVYVVMRNGNSWKFGGTVD